MATIGKHRHAVAGGYARGEETRARIITAAMKMFGERGYEGASTRDIATSAGVNAPALQYYFDNKEGVYIACIEYIVKRIWAFMSEVVERAEAAIENGAPDAELIEAFCDIHERLAEFMFMSPDASEWRLFMAREQAGEGPVAAFQIKYQRVTRRMSGVFSTIVGRLIGRPADDEETLIRTMTLSGQLTVFKMAPRSVLAMLNWDAIDADRLALLQRVIREQTVALLRSMSAVRAVSRIPRTPRAKRPAGRRARIAATEKQYRS